jgi:hypothetical protein
MANLVSDCHEGALARAVGHLPSSQYRRPPIGGGGPVSDSSLLILVSQLNHRGVALNVYLKFVHDRQQSLRSLRRLQTGCGRSRPAAERQLGPKADLRRETRWICSVTAERTGQQRQC